MGLLPQMKIAQKLPLALVGSALLVSAGVGIASYLIGSGTAGQLSGRQIETIAIQTSAQLGSYLDGIAKDLTITAATESTQTILRDLNINWGKFLTGSMATNPVAALQTAYITNNPDAANRELLDVSTAEKRTNYDFTHSKIHPAFRRQLQARGYADLVVLSPTGDLVYSVKKRDDLATNFAAGGVGAETGLGKAFQAAAAMNEGGQVAFQDFSAYAPAAGLPEGFMATPVFDNRQKLVGVLAAALSTAPVNAIMNK